MIELFRPIGLRRGLPLSARSQPMIHTTIQPGSCRRIGHGNYHHFFGYYNKTAWDKTGRFLLANRTTMMDARLTPNLAAEVGYFDLHNNERYHVVGRTTAWNWQMGCQLQWLEGRELQQLIYNCRVKEAAGVYSGLGSTIYDVSSGRSRCLPLPIYVAAPNSRYALCVDYRRLYITQETIGYCEHDPQPVANAPADDGIHYMDLESGAHRLLVSYDELRNFYPRQSMTRAIHWISHIEINPSSSRILFLHHWSERVKDETSFLHRLITMDPDGSNMRLLECSDHPQPQLEKEYQSNGGGAFDSEKSERQISHPIWRDAHHILVWAPHVGRTHYHLYEDASAGRVDIIGNGILSENGHITFSPTNKRWLLSDTYPNERTHERALFLFDTQTGRRHDLGQFHADPGLSKENRCDLHPRWSRDGQQICIDSVHENARQMYLLNVSHIVNN